MSEETKSVATPVPREIRLTDVRDWLLYYSECRQYLLVMGQKFTALLGQASLFSFTASAAILTLAEKLSIRYPKNLWVALPAGLGLTMYAVIIACYFLQVRRSGKIMLDIEEEQLGLDERLGLIQALRTSGGAFYRRNWAFTLVLLYVVILVFLPLATARVCI